MRPSLRPQSGIMLLEALLALLIFSIGILSLIGMQGMAIKNTADARYRSEAAILAQQIISQIWLDLPNISSYDDSNVGTYAPRTAWRNQVAATLPGVDIAGALRVPSIVVNTAANNEVTVIIYWLQPGTTVDTTCTPQPLCSSHKFQFINQINQNPPI